MAKQGMRSARLSQLDVEDPDFRLGSFPNLAAQGIGQQLMTETQSQVGLVSLHHPFANRCLLGAEPWVLVFLPHVHGPAHDKHRIEAIQGWNHLPFVQLHGGPWNAVGGEKFSQSTRMLGFDVLEHQQPGLLGHGFR